MPEAPGVSASTAETMPAVKDSAVATVSPASSACRTACPARWWRLLTVPALCAKAQGLDDIFHAGPHCDGHRGHHDGERDPHQPRREGTKRQEIKEDRRSLHHCLEFAAAGGGNDSIADDEESQGRDSPFPDQDH